MPAPEGTISKKDSDRLRRTFLAGRDRQLDDDEWSPVKATISRAIAAYTIRTSIDFAAGTKKMSEAKLRSLITHAQNSAQIVKNMGSKELNWIYLKLGGFPIVKSKAAHAKGIDRIDDYLQFSATIADAAMDALHPVKRKRNIEREAVSRLITALEGLWKKIHKTSGLNSNDGNEKRNFIYFGNIVVDIAKFPKKLNESTFRAAVKRARKPHSEDSEASDDLKISN